MTTGQMIQPTTFYDDARAADETPTTSYDDASEVDTPTTSYDNASEAETPTTYLPSSCSW